MTGFNEGIINSSLDGEHMTSFATITITKTAYVLHLIDKISMQRLDNSKVTGTRTMLSNNEFYFPRRLEPDNNQ